jgi:hypothetical protein
MIPYQLRTRRRLAALMLRHQRSQSFTDVASKKIKLRKQVLRRATQLVRRAMRARPSCEKNMSLDLRPALTGKRCILEYEFQ